MVSGVHTQTQKQAAVEFLKMVISGEIEDAYARFVNVRDGRHHNHFFPAGFPLLKKAMIEDHGQFPNKRLVVKNVLQDGDLVAVHSHLILNEGTKGMSTMHLFRFDGDRIVELWDFGQEVPADSPNVDGAF